MPNQITNETRRSCVWVVCTGTVLAGFLVVVRAHAMGYGWTWLQPPFRRLPYVLLGSGYDAIYVTALSAVFLGIVFLLRRRPGMQRACRVALLVAAMLSFVAGVANLPFVKIMGRPFNYQWLYYSDFLQSFDARHAILANLSWTSVSMVVLCCGTLAVLSWATHRRVLACYESIASKRTLAAGVAAILAGYLVAGAWYVSRDRWPSAQYENPVLAFAKSWLTANEQPGLFTMSTRFGSEDFRPAGERTPTSSFPSRPDRPAVSNVVMIVLESVGAAYLDSFGGSHGVTPHLNRYRDRSAIFRRVYAHAPHTASSLWTLQTGMYPWINYRFVNRDFPQIDIPSLSGELKRRGYRTAFFNSSDNRFQKIEEFMAPRGFDRVEDWRSMRRDQPVLRVDDPGWPYQDGIEDRRTLECLTQWIEEAPHQPFFAMMWTLGTHYPYFPLQKQKSYVPDNKYFNRYLNALREIDEVIGQFLDHLESRGLAKKTLVVVIGDHGESFYQHGVGGHGQDLYEEAVRVPVQCINPVLFRNEVHDTLGGLVDVPATIFDALHLPLPSTWQGISLLAVKRPKRVYYFALSTDYLFGYREGNRKFVYNASREAFEVYDLARDPEEKSNLAAGTDAQTRVEGLERLAAWVQFQNGYLGGLLPSARSQTESTASASRTAE